LTQANMVSNGGGALETGDLVFPMFSSVEICGATCPNWQKQYSYFVRVKEECDADAVTASIDGNELVVPLDCELTDSGPSGVFIAVGAMILLLGYVFLFQRKEG
ncbi:MAG: hypothetical protein K9M51_04255, partial [Candidatus Gracilibacteria bacterium]|nr:hypothetical protein [Candidatus Gracilibacteria bacterium]